MEVDPGLAAIVAAALPVIGGLVGRTVGSRGKKKGFARLETELRIDGTSWRGEYTDQNDAQGKPQRTGRIDFKQYGSRVVGEALSLDESRKWILEGVLAQRRLCYVYVDSDHATLSLGTAVLEMNDAGDQLEGSWIGWSPDGARMTPQRVRLNRL